MVAASTAANQRKLTGSGPPRTLGLVAAAHAAARLDRPPPSTSWPCGSAPRLTPRVSACAGPLMSLRSRRDERPGHTAPVRHGGDRTSGRTLRFPGILPTPPVGRARTQRPNGRVGPPPDRRSTAQPDGPTPPPPPHPEPPRHRPAGHRLTGFAFSDGPLGKPSSCHARPLYRDRFSPRAEREPIRPCLVSRARSPRQPFSCAPPASAPQRGPQARRSMLPTTGQGRGDRPRGRLRPSPRQE